mmetsp:Transcript_43512/g.57574  ORF Transcript_43512/g.57574 Transcript_43512/m.57574 type:complete len:84 (+) Transcript_43512:539-790(+)
MFTAIRLALLEESKDEEGDQGMQDSENRLDLLKNTELMPILHRSLMCDTRSSPDELLYSLKHEAVWILINFSLGSAEVVEHTI